MSRQDNFFWGSSYDRGLDVVLYIWPDILAKNENAKLHICYGWDLFDKAAINNPERREWKDNVVSMMNQKGIIHYGRIGKKELKEVRKQCGYWLYPTYFDEINCITALEVQNDGVVPIVVNRAALKETVGAGYRVDGDISQPETLEKYKKAVFEAIDKPDLWEKESKKAKKFAKNYFYNNIAEKWLPYFANGELDYKVTIYTPTVREGFWNIMANNIANQTYKNIEWIIVDDHKDDRSEIATKYAKKYNLDIRYMRGKKRNVKRTYSLINANNTAIEAAKGELFVFLQDFVLMPEDGIERLMETYRHHLNDFIAPVDVYHKPKIKPDTTNKEDWFNGELDVIGDFMRENVRLQRIGLRQSKTITDFEQNYGAVGTHVLKELGGYYEFFDEALGWDDTEIIYRAFKNGNKLVIDDTNVATCIDHWGTLGKDEGGTSVNRTRRLNDPRYIWMTRKIEKGLLPVKRTQEIDDKINLQYEIPKDVADEDCVDWMKKHTEEIIKEWE